MSAYVAADLTGEIRLGEVSHRHGVRRLQTTQGNGTMARRLPVHGAEHGHLGSCPIDTELDGHR